MELCRHENCVFFLPVNIHMWCDMLAFLAIQHTTRVCITVILYKILIFSDTLFIRNELQRLMDHSVDFVHQEL